MWILALLLLLVTICTFILLFRPQPVTRQIAKVVNGRYRIWAAGVDPEGNKGRYYLVAYGVGKQQTADIVGGAIFFYFRANDDTTELTADTVPLYLSPLGGIVDTTFTEYFDVRFVQDKVIINPSGASFAGTTVSVCNDSSQCIPKILHFKNTVGGTVFMYERHEDGFRLYENAINRAYVIVGNPLCPVGMLADGVAQPIVDTYNVVRAACASIPTGQSGGPRFAIISTKDASTLHFAK